MRLSIITVNRNDAEGLRRTIESVRRNAPPESEYIVIDGASNDGSVSVIEDARDCIDSWISEPDSGVFQAMNKGIDRARGEYCLFLNSGDILCNNTLANVMEKIDGNSRDVYYFDAALVSGASRMVIEYPKNIDVNFFVSGMINHQNALIPRSLFETIGRFDESLRLSSDWLFFLKAAYSRSTTYIHLGPPIVEFELGGISNRPGSGDILRREREYGIKQVFGFIAPTILELIEFRESVYGNTIALFGKTKVLDFILKTYRFFARRLKMRPKK